MPPSIASSPVKNLVSVPDCLVLVALFDPELDEELESPNLS